MEKIPTAEDYLNKKYPDFENLDNGNIWVNIEELMIEFAKLHVEAALEKYIQEIEVKRVLCNYPPINFINKDDLRKAYPLENIK